VPGISNHRARSHSVQPPPPPFGRGRSKSRGNYFSQDDYFEAYEAGVARQAVTLGAAGTSSGASRTRPEVCEAYPPPRLRASFLYSGGDHPESFVAAQFSCRFVRPARLKSLAVLLALCLAACGRYGPLEPPPDPNAPPKPANSSNPANMSSGLSKPSIPPIVPPKTPFFLDFLLK
jgi:predicted small lipoprotein YifL